MCVTVYGINVSFQLTHFPGHLLSDIYVLTKGTKGLRTIRICPIGYSAALHSPRSCLWSPLPCKCHVAGGMSGHVQCVHLSQGTELANACPSPSDSSCSHLQRCPPLACISRSHTLPSARSGGVPALRVLSSWSPTPGCSRAVLPTLLFHSES